MAASPTKAMDLYLTTAKTSDATEEIAAPTLAKRMKKVLQEMFEGHEEYLGMTPD